MSVLLNLARSRGGASDPVRSWGGLVDWMNYAGHSYPVLNQTAPGSKLEHVDHSFTAYVSQVYQRSGPVFAVMAARRRVVSQARFSFQQVRSGRPGELFSTPALEVLRTPWPGATSADLIGRMLHHADLAGNAFAYRRTDGSLKVLRPDWVTIARGDDPDLPEGGQLLGYIYEPGGSRSGAAPVLLGAHEVAHFAPEPDPLAEFRGMSWLRPVIGSAQSHAAAAQHKARFFSNGATPNMVIKFDPSVPVEKLEAYQRIFDEKFAGVSNAYKTIFLGGGGDPMVVGSDFRQLDFRDVQGVDEASIAAAGGVPPVLVGFTEGLAASTYSNYGQAKEHFRDTTVFDLLENLTASLQTIIPTPQGSRLWFDLWDVPFFRDDALKTAEVIGQQANTIRTLTDAGFLPASVVAAVKANDMSLLEHSNLYSVQLQPAGVSESGGGDGE